MKLENSKERLTNHHSFHACFNQVCALHNRTNHHMRKWPQHWRDDRKIMERICSCGVGHPDPDDYRIRMKLDDGIHGCCGWCQIKENNDQ